MSLSKKDPFSIVGRNPRSAPAAASGQEAVRRPPVTKPEPVESRTKTLNARLSAESYVRLQSETARLSAEWGHRVFPATVAESWLRRLMEVGVDEAIERVGLEPLDSELTSSVSFQVPLDVSQWVVVTAASRRTYGRSCSTVRQIAELAARLSDSEASYEG